MFDENNKKFNSKNAEYMEQKLVKKFVKKNYTVLELGARYGTISCVINKILENKTNQVSVEPDEKIWNALEKNKRNNDCHFHIVKGFISNKKLKLKRRGNASFSFPGESTIPSYTLNEIESKYNLKFNCLVADCEGYLESFFDENPNFYNQLELIIFEEDNIRRCNYDKIKKNLIENNFIKVKMKIDKWNLKHFVYKKNNL